MLNSYNTNAFIKSPYLKYLIFSLIKLFCLIALVYFLSFVYFYQDGENSVQKFFPKNFFYCLLSFLFLFTRFNGKNIQYYNQYKNNFAMHLNFVFNILTSRWFVTYITVFSVFCIINNYSKINILVFFLFNYSIIFLINVFQRQNVFVMLLYTIFIGTNTFINSNPFEIYINFLPVFSGISGILLLISIFNMHKVRYINYSEKEIFVELITGRNTKIINYVLFEFVNILRNKKTYLIQSFIFYAGVMIFFSSPTWI